jgi:hypothetical protein
VLVVGERPRSVAIEIESSEADSSDSDWKAEDGSDARVDGGAGEGEPSRCRGQSEIRFQHRKLVVMGVHARPFPECELEVLDEIAHSVGRAHRAAGRIVRHEHDPGATHATDLGAHLA